MQFHLRNYGLAASCFQRTSRKDNITRELLRAEHGVLKAAIVYRSALFLDVAMYIFRKCTCGILDSNERCPSGHHAAIMLCTPLRNASTGIW